MTPLGDVYEKVSGSWVPRANIAGPPGATGANGADAALSSLPYWQKKTTDGANMTYSTAAARAALDTTKWRLSITTTGKPVLVGAEFLCQGQSLMGFIVDGAYVAPGNELSYESNTGIHTANIGPVVVPMAAGVHTVDVSTNGVFTVYDRAGYEDNRFWAIELSGGIGPQGPSGGTAPLVTSLPASPVDGQECMYVADAAAGIIWHLRYRTASPSVYKWECVGGPPIVRNANGYLTGVGGAHVDIPGSSLTVPLKGDYDFAWGGSGSNAVSTGIFGIFLWIGPTLANEMQHTPLQNAVAGGWTYGSREGVFPVTAANTIVKLTGFSWNGACSFGLGGGYGWPPGFVKALPVRVGL